MTQDATPRAYPPGPDRREIVARAREIREEPAWFFLEMTQRFGDIVHWRSGLLHYYLVNHPDYVKDVLVTNNRKFIKGHGQGDLAQMFGKGLVTSEGATHRRERRMMQPFFRFEHIAETFSDSMVRYTSEMLEEWSDGDVVDVHQAIMSLTLRIVAKVLFDADFDGRMIDEFSAALNDAWRVMHSPIAGKLDSLDTKDGVAFRDDLQTMDRIIYGIIEEHRASGADRGDVLSLLMQVRDGDGRPMPDLWLRDHTMTLLGAGHDTTANGMVWTMYLLAQNPAALASLQDEVDAVLGGRLPSAADLPSLPYTMMVMKEGWRMLPPVWNIERRAVEDHELGGYSIPAGSLISMSPFAMGRNPTWYSDPTRFDPQRWTPAAESSRPKHTYFPFAAGPRVCLGEYFAQIESVLVVSAVAQEWELELVPDHPVELFPAVSLRPKYGMRMTVHRRRRRAA